MKEVVKDIYSKGFFHLFSANFLIHIIEFGSQLFVAWILLADDIGRIKSFQTFAAVAVIIAGLGFNTSILKLCSEKNIKKIEKQILFATAIKTTLFFSILTILIVFLLSYFNLISNDVITNKLFIYYSFSIPLIALNNLLVSYYQALKEFKKVSFLLIIARIIHVAIIITLTYLFNLKGFILGIVVGFLISSILLLSKTSFLQGWKMTTIAHFKKNWELAKYAFLANSINMITLYLDIFLLNHFITNANNLGFYGFALTLIAGLRIITTTVQQFVTPFFSEFSSNYKQSIKAFKRANKLFVTLIIVAGLAAIFIVPILIQLVYGGKYDHSIYYFQVLTIVWLIRSLVSLKGPFLLGAGFVNVNFYNVLIVFFITIIPYWYLVKTYDIKGAVYGQILTAVILFVVVNINFSRILKKLKANHEQSLQK